MKAFEQFQPAPAVTTGADRLLTSEKAAGMDQPLRQPQDVPLAHAQTKQDVLDTIAAQFTFPAHFGKNFDALYDCMTDPLHKSGLQPGFVVVLEHIPATAKFDKEAREQLLDIFRDAADYWSDRKIPFRCFYSFL